MVSAKKGAPAPVDPLSVNTTPPTSDIVEDDEQEFEVVIPKNMKPGDKMRIPVPSTIPGKVEKVVIAVPADAEPGSTISFTLSKSWIDTRVKMKAAVRMQALARGKKDRDAAQAPAQAPPMIRPPSDATLDAADDAEAAAIEKENALVRHMALQTPPVVAPPAPAPPAASFPDPPKTPTKASPPRVPVAAPAPAAQTAIVTGSAAKAMVAASPKKAAQKVTIAAPPSPPIRSGGIMRSVILLLLVGGLLAAVYKMEMTGSSPAPPAVVPRAPNALLTATKAAGSAVTTATMAAGSAVTVGAKAAGNATTNAGAALVQTMGPLVQTMKRVPPKQYIIVAATTAAAIAAPAAAPHVVRAAAAVAPHALRAGAAVGGALGSIPGVVGKVAAKAVQGVGATAGATAGVVMQGAAATQAAAGQCMAAAAKGVMATSGAVMQGVAATQGAVMQCAAATSGAVMQGVAATQAAGANAVGAVLSLLPTSSAPAAVATTGAARAGVFTKGGLALAGARLLKAWGAASKVAKTGKVAKVATGAAKAIRLSVPQAVISYAGKDGVRKAVTLSPIKVVLEALPL